MLPMHSLPAAVSGLGIECAFPLPRPLARPLRRARSLSLGPQGVPFRRTRLLCAATFTVGAVVTTGHPQQLPKSAKGENLLSQGGFFGSDASAGGQLQGKSGQMGNDSPKDLRTVLQEVSCNNLHSLHVRSALPWHYVTCQGCFFVSFHSHTSSAVRGAS